MIIWLNLQSGPSDRTGPDHLHSPRTEERMSHLGVRACALALALDSFVVTCDKC